MKRRPLSGGRNRWSEGNLAKILGYGGPLFRVVWIRWGKGERLDLVRDKRVEWRDRKGMTSWKGRYLLICQRRPELKWKERRE